MRPRAAGRSPTTELARDGPALATARVNVSSSPTRTGSLWVLTIDRSAACTTSTTAVSVLLSGFGSVVGEVDRGACWCRCPASAAGIDRDGDTSGAARATGRRAATRRGSRTRRPGGRRRSGRTATGRPPTRRTARGEGVGDGERALRVGRAEVLDGDGEGRRWCRPAPGRRPSCVLVRARSALRLDPHGRGRGVVRRASPGVAVETRRGVGQHGAVGHARRDPRHDPDDARRRRRRPDRRRHGGPGAGDLPAERGAEPALAGRAGSPRRRWCRPAARRARRPRRHPTGRCW